MFKFILVTVIYQILINISVVSQPSCSVFWKYVRSSGQVQGLLTLPHSDMYNDHNIQIILMVGARLPNSYVGDISLVKDHTSALEDITNGRLIQYRVRFPIQDPWPQLTEVRYNNKILCTGQKISAQYITTITLDHSLYRILTTDNHQHRYNLSPRLPQYQENVESRYNFNGNNQNYENFESILNTLGTSRPIIQTTSTTTQTPQQIFNTKREDKQLSDNQCGVPFKDFPESTGLVINGNAGAKGQFPWYAAFYYNGQNYNGFLCGGSLVSQKTVITAAHCIHNKNDIKKLPEESLFFFGKYYIKSPNFTDESEYIVSPVTKFIVHPDWKSEGGSFDGDIAIVILTRTIQYTSFIKPICLWTQTNDYSDIINQKGMLVGYGKTQSISTASDIPYWVVLPVVDEGTCLRSNPGFGSLTSKRTFCVGNRDGRGPCQGDSGGPFTVKNNGKWYLRGIVSSSLFDKIDFTCDTKNYAVFTDVVAFNSWIKQNMI